MKKVFVIAFFISSSNNVFAQTQSGRQYNGLIEFGHIHVSNDVPLSSESASRLRVIGIKHFEAFSVGAGFGLDGYRLFDYNTAPLFIDIRYYKLGNRFVPYLDMGKAIRLSKEFQQGFFLNSGITFQLTSKNWLHGSFGYNLQKIKNIRNTGIGTTQSSVNFGLVFSLWN